ncbi:hypothetical protein [Pseudorhodoferax sp.]|uniref:hypothetical protein n=1 Tax=Pseudorhodoferax sp. TaxID=1993553 RepID=UPI002DD61EC3|nr:hypothetical protein [Pseudorhodoferax sp.]
MRAAAIAVACLPQAAPEPAKDKVRRLSRHPKIRAAKNAFTASDAGAKHPVAPAAIPAVETPASEPNVARTG